MWFRFFFIYGRSPSHCTSNASYSVNYFRGIPHHNRSFWPQHSIYFHHQINEVTSVMKVMQQSAWDRYLCETIFYVCNYTNYDRKVIILHLHRGRCWKLRSDINLIETLLVLGRSSSKSILGFSANQTREINNHMLVQVSFFSHTLSPLVQVKNIWNQWPKNFTSSWSLKCSRPIGKKQLKPKAVASN